MKHSNAKQKILVTGGAGFIGSHVAEAYLKAGHKVVVVDNLSTGKRKNVPKLAKFYRADIRNAKRMEAIFKKERPKVVNHHAGQIDVRYSVAHPAEDAKVNVLAGIGLLELSLKYGVQKWIYASTGGALYGEVPKGKAKEDGPIDPISPYGTAKYSLEKYLELFGRLRRLRLRRLQYTILRYANVFGPRQIPKAEGGVVAVFIDTLLQGRRPTIFGSGRQQRDFVYVEDVARANLKALNRAEGEAVNIGRGKPTSILELFSLLQKELKLKGNPKFAPKRPGEVFRSVLAIKKAKQLLNWQPTTSLTAGLEKTIAWHRRCKHLLL